MSYSLVLLHGTTTLATLPIATFFNPTSALVYDTSEPPVLAAVDKTWTLRGRLKGTSSANAAALWANLRAVVEGTGGSQVNGCRLLDGIGATVEDLSVAASYALFRIERFDAEPSPRAELQWHSEVYFTIQITGRHRLVNVRTLEQHDSFVYDEAGLLTRTLAGTVETAPGTSAVAQARTLGLTLPGGQYAFITAGPEGVNVEQLDAGDTRASWTSSYGQSGASLPAGVGPDFSTRVESSTSSGQTISITTVTARGPGAATAVAAKKPSGNLFSQVVTSDAYRLTATAVYVQKSLSQPGRMLMLWSFSIAGGGPGADATERTDQRPAALHVLPISAVRITETVSVEVIGTPSDNDFSMPAALSLDGVFEDGAARRVDPGHRVEIGTTRAADRWVAGCTRVYLAAEIPAGLPTLIGQQVLRPDSSATKATTPGKILSSGKAGSGGNDLSGLGGLGIAGARAGSGDARINFGAL